eukprot:TRINITY_DN11720_c0_g1_i1.p1 TRINITY_DN11720_c0_g1~~TRINITY_DN11720_c0_g1_i1.p1  ORF type:complete len:289 (+),score=20.29 TRINITY_DN11720_c0_g1_i1:251-1117(+)
MSSVGSIAASIPSPRSEPSLRERSSTTGKRLPRTRGVESGDDEDEEGKEKKTDKGRESGTDHEEDEAVYMPKRRSQLNSVRSSRSASPTPPSSPGATPRPTYRSPRTNGDLNELEQEITALATNFTLITVGDTTPRCTAPDAVEMATGGPLSNNGRTTLKKASSCGAIALTHSKAEDMAAVLANMCATTKASRKNSNSPSPVKKFSDKQPKGLPRLNLAGITHDNDRAALTSPNKSRAGFLVSPRSAFSRPVGGWSPRSSPLSPHRPPEAGVRYTPRDALLNEASACS